MVKVALYLRKSREDEELKEETLARHETMLLEYCARNNLTITATYKEVVSGESISNRPQMQKLMDDVSQGLYDGVVCIEIERLSRGNPIDQMEILDVFKGSNTKIYTLNKVYDLSKEDLDEEYFEFALFMSRREYKTITRRLQRGRLQATREGYFIGSHLPYGFDKIRDGKGCILVPKEDEAEIVKYIFTEYSKGISAGAIARNLNERGIPAKEGNTWYHSVIVEMVQNQVYVGNIRLPHNEGWVKGKHEGIIDNDLFDKVQAVHMAKGAKVRKNDVMRNPLAGLVRCSCGRILQRKVCSRNKTYNYLTCPHNMGCTNRRVYVLEDVEREVLEQLKETLKDFNYFLIDESKKEQRDATQNELDILNKELRAKEKQIESACDMLERGVYDIELFKSRTSQLEEKIKNIKERIKEVETQPREDIRIKTAIPKIEKVLELYPSLSIEDRNKLLRAIIKEITLEDGMRIELLI